MLNFVNSMAQIGLFLALPLCNYCLMKVFSPAYRNRVKCRCEALLGTFQPAIAEAKAKVT